MRVVAQGLIWTALGAATFWLTIYWWFVPHRLLLDIPVAHPPSWLRVAAGILVLPSIYGAVYVAEQSGKHASERWGPPLYRTVRIGTKVTDVVVGAGALAWLVGLVAFGPERVGALFLAMTLNTFFRMLKKGYGVSIPSATKRTVAEIEALSAETAMAKDPRPPILYLRGFDKEARRSTLFGKFEYFANPRGFYVASGMEMGEVLNRDMMRRSVDSQRSSFDEQMIFATYFNTYGPYISVARPGENLENMDLGAAKLFIHEGDWRHTILDLIEKCGAVVIDAATSVSLMWEIDQVVAMVRPRKVLLILPRRESGYRAFYNECRDRFPRGLPYKFPESRLVMFADDWSPIPLANDTLILSDALEPFLEKSKLASVQIEVPFKPSRTVGSLSPGANDP